MGFVTVHRPMFNHSFSCDHEIRDRLKLNGDRHEITNREAIKVLSKIKRNSKILSFITKPAVVILTGFVTLGLAVALNVSAYMVAPILPLAIALKVASLILFGAGAFLISLGIRLSCTGHLQLLSNNYNQRALEAQRYIQQLKQNNTLTLELQN